jgi:flagellar motor switch protein FliM
MSLLVLVLCLSHYRAAVEVVEPITSARQVVVVAVAAVHLENTLSMFIILLPQVGQSRIRLVLAVLVAQQTEALEVVQYSEH